MAVSKESRKSGYCFLCKSLVGREVKKIATFSANKANIEVWQQKIPGLEIGARLCDAHFEPDDIIKGRTILDNFYPYKSWKLSEHAVPKYHLTRRQERKPKKIAGKPLKSIATNSKHREPNNLILPQNLRALAPKSGEKTVPITCPSTAILSTGCRPLPTVGENGGPTTRILPDVNPDNQLLPPENERNCLTHILPDISDGNSVEGAQSEPITHILCDVSEVNPGTPANEIITTGSQPLPVEDEQNGPTAHILPDITTSCDQNALHSSKVVRHLAEGQNGVLDVEYLANSVHITTDDVPIPNIVYKWYRTGSVVKTVEEASPDDRIYCDGPKLNLRTVLLDDGGEYKCEAITPALTHTFTVKLIIQYKPVVVDPPQLSKAACDTGQRAQMVCQARGTPNLTFDWSSEGISLTNSDKYTVSTVQVGFETWESTLRISAVNPRDYGQYICVVANSIGATVKQVTLQGLSRPDTPLVLRVRNALHESVLLSWMPGFDGGLPIRSYRIRYKESVAKCFRYCDVYPETATSFSLDGLKSGTEYYFSIRASNSLGASSYTAENGVKGMTKPFASKEPLKRTVESVANNCSIGRKNVSTNYNLPSSKKIACTNCQPQIARLKRKLDLKKQQYKGTQRKLRRAQIALERAKTKEEETMVLVDNLNKSIKKLKKQTLEESITILPQQQQVIIRTFFKKRKTELKSKTNQSHGMKYDAEFLKLAMSLRKKSSLAYKHIRQEGLLPLPTPETLRRLMSLADANLDPTVVTTDQLSQMPLVEPPDNSSPMPNV